MKQAKRRQLVDRNVGRIPRKRYRLADLLAQMPEGKISLSAELRAWEEMRPVGCEFGAGDNS